jgi:hypothetical protein
MRLVPIGDADKSWSALKTNWRRAAEAAEEDFSTFALGPLAAIDALIAKSSGQAGLYGLIDSDGPHAFCQVNKLLIPRFDGPVLRARFMNVAPAYDFGTAGPGKYQQLLVELFSGIIWLAHNTVAASHVLFHLRSPSDAQYLAALQSAVADSPFQRFAINGAWVECDLRVRKPEEMM